MKNKVVVWGTNAQEEKVLIALELQTASNKVMLYTFPEAVATDEFVNKMMNEWREGKVVEFPEGHTAIERELSVTESLLPDDLKVDRSDVITRAQTEWHFAVLSSKLHAAYQQELAEFQEKIRSLSSYDAGIFTNLKGFWDKVQGQSRERNLYRAHADQLRDGINALFEDLKSIRAKVQNELMSASSGVYDEFNKALDDIDARIQAGGAKLNSVFDDLKAMQRRYRDARLSNEHRNKVWERIDAAFKAAKERKFGPSVNDGSVADRHDRRLAGLQDAVKRMQESVRRDEEELNFQRKKINATEGQLEAQIRMAKIKMIEERLSSKREKVTEMQQTLHDVQRQAGSAREKESKRAEKDAERQKFMEAKERAKSEIAAGIRSRDTNAPGSKQDTMFEAASTVLGDLLMDALDTVKAVATVAADKAEDVMHDVVDKIEDMAEALTKKEEAPADAPPATEAAVAEAPANEEPTAAVAEPVAETAEAVEESAPKAEEAAEPAAEAEAVASDEQSDAPAEKPKRKAAAKKASLEEEGEETVS